MTVPPEKHLVNPTPATSTGSASRVSPSRESDPFRLAEAGTSTKGLMSGLPFGQAQGNDTAPLLTGQNGGVTSSAGQRQKRLAA